VINNFEKCGVLVNLWLGLNHFIVGEMKAIVSIVVKWALLILCFVFVQLKGTFAS
jgi:hypothetical protein